MFNVDSLKMLAGLKAELEAMYEKEKQLIEDLSVFNIALPPNDELRKLEAVSVNSFVICIVF